MANKYKKKYAEKKFELGSSSKGLVPMENANDLISHLPEDVLSCIVSRLPFRSAVKTSFLSLGWRDAWKLTYLLRKGNMNDAVAALSEFLIHYDDIYRKQGNWGIQFTFDRGNILLATVSPHKSLHLDFSKGKQEFPRQFGWLVELNQGRPQAVRPPSFTFYVKSLYLISIGHNTIELVNRLVSHFPFLESLTISKCDGLRSLHIYGDTRLTHLTILDCLQLKSLRIRTAVLSSVRFRGAFPWIWPEYRHLLTDTMFDFRRGPGYNFLKERDFCSLLLSIFWSDTLTLCRWFFDQINTDRADWRDIFFHLHELWWIDYSVEGDYSNSLVTFLKLCPHVERLFVTIDPDSYRPQGRGAKPINVNRNTKLAKLRIIKLDGFADQESEIKLAIRLKEVFETEAPVVASSSGGKLLRRLVQAPDLCEGKPSYKFVEGSKHTVQLSSNHPHMNV